MDINQKENACCMYIIKYRCLSTLADPEGGGNPARASLTVVDLWFVYAPNAKNSLYFTRFAHNLFTALF